MPVILNIDTATENASVCLANGSTVLGMTESTDQKNHASFIQPAIKQVTSDAAIALRDIDAVAVTAGPGSYTGLRVGMATAKGICYALQKPLILINTLETIAQAALQEHSDASLLFCPMIDARRMEVFTSVYNHLLQEIQPAHALIVDEHSFDTLLANNHLVFSGSGAAKLKAVIRHSNVIFSGARQNASHLAERSLIAYNSNRFADLAYSEPLYVKEFFTPVPPKQR